MLPENAPLPKRIALLPVRPVLYAGPPRAGSSQEFVRPVGEGLHLHFVRGRKVPHAPKFRHLIRLAERDANVIVQRRKWPAD
jgi:hypothetical protein